MYKILTLNAISDVIYAQLGEGYAVSAGETQPDAVFVRTLTGFARAHGGKTLPDGSKNPTHGAAVIGDTVGDPCKDTSGPALNILIKLMSMVCIVFAPVIIKFAPVIQSWFGVSGILK